MIYNIYAPILDNTQSVCTVDEMSHGIYFSLPATITNNIGHIQIKVTLSSNNQSVVNYKKYIDGIIYKDFSEVIKDNTTNKYYIELTPDDVISNTGYNNQGEEVQNNMWSEGTLYKVQMRFGGTSVLQLNNFLNEEFLSWKTKNVSEGTFSEWSNVMLFAAILLPEAKFIFSELDDAAAIDLLSGLEKSNIQLKASMITPNHFPNFTVEIKQNSQAKHIENLKTYHFQLTTISKTEENKKIILNQIEETSAIFDHTIGENDKLAICKHSFEHELKNGHIYKVEFFGTTVNGYSLYATTEIALPVEETQNMFSLSTNSASIEAKETASISIFLTYKNNPNHSQNITNNYLLLRTDEKSHYSKWEKLVYFDEQALSQGETRKIYQDFLIESGIKYQYKVYALFVDEETNVSLPIETTAATVTTKPINFEYSYLYCNGIQLPLKFNNKMSSFKHTVLATKTDTIGSKYPTIVRNGHVYYAEFPITGLISLNMDDYLTFCHRVIENPYPGIYFGNELIIPEEKFPNLTSVDRNTAQSQGLSDVDIILNYNHNLTDDNIFIERKFRETVERFLNNGKPKLFKSATEGNFIVSLINISLTPNQQLGRMISEFTATAYEIANWTIADSIEQNIHTVGQPDLSIWKPSNDLFVGQWFGSPYTYLKNNNGTIIKKNTRKVFEESSKFVDTISDVQGTDYIFQNFEDCWIDAYPFITKDDIIIAENLLNLKKIELENRQKILDETPNAIIGNDNITVRDVYPQKIAQLEAEIPDLENKLYETKMILKNQGSENDVYFLKVGASDKRYYLKSNQKFQIPFAFQEDKNNNQLKKITISHPMVINYLANRKRRNYPTLSYSFGGHETTSIGSLSGIFSLNNSVLSSVNPFYRQTQMNTLLKNEMIDPTKKDGVKAQYNYYYGLDFFKMIKDQIKSYIESIYLDEGEHFIQNDSLEWIYQKNNIKNNKSLFLKYELMMIKQIEIEAAPGTQLLFKAKPDDEFQTIVIGSTGKYIFKNINPNSSIQFNSFNTTTFEADIKYIFTSLQTINVNLTPSIEEEGE